MPFGRAVLSQGPADRLDLVAQGLDGDRAGGGRATAGGQAAGSWPVAPQTGTLTPMAAFQARADTFLDGVARGGLVAAAADLLGAEFLLALALGFDAALGRFDAVRAGPGLLIEHVSLAVRRRGLGVVVLAEALVGASALSVHLCPGVVQLGPSTLDVHLQAGGALGAGLRPLGKRTLLSRESAFTRSVASAVWRSASDACSLASA